MNNLQKLSGLAAETERLDALGLGEWPRGPLHVATSGEVRG